MVGLASPLAKPLARSLALPLTDPEGVGVLGFSNIRTSNTAMFKAARNAVRAGTRRARIAFPGSSSWAGSGAGAGVTAREDARSKSAGAKMVAALVAAGENAEFNQSLFGTANYISDPYNLYDPRIASVPTGWNAATAMGPGGPAFRHNGANTNALEFTPPGAWDTADVAFSRVTTSTSVEILIDGVVKATVNPSGTTGTFLKQTVTADSVGVHTISFRKASAVTNTVNLASVQCYDAADHQLAILGMGWGGSTAVDWADQSTETRPRAALATYSLDGMFMLNGLNDWYNSGVLATFETNYRANVAAAKAYADVVCCVPQYSNPADPTGASYEVQDQFKAVIRQAAIDYDCPIFDIATVIGGNYDTAPSGTYAGDYHMREMAHTKIGNAMAAFILSL